MELGIGLSGDAMEFVPLGRTLSLAGLPVLSMQVVLQFARIAQLGMVKIIIQFNVADNEQISGIQHARAIPSPGYE